MTTTMPIHRIQIHDEDGVWRTLELRDISITRDSEAHAFCFQYSRDTGHEYRAQVKCGKRWITLHAPGSIY